jgi:hypothetical protein
VEFITFLIGLFFGLLGPLIANYQQHRHAASVEMRVRARELYHDRIDLYARFAGTAAEFGNRLYADWLARKGMKGDPRQTNLEVDRAHDAFMEPLWRMRILGSPEVRAEAEKILEVVLKYQKEYDDTSQPDPNPVLDVELWRPARDRFLELVRDEVERFRPKRRRDRVAGVL